MIEPRSNTALVVLRLVSCLVAACAWPVLGAVYYIDWNAANDSANGTSTSTPWKRAPGMKNFAGSYTHSAGDRFIFKGGVTWPNAAFQMRITQSGNSSNDDYYGVDTSWYTGASWTRPIFNAEQTRIGGGTAGAIVFLDNVMYITIDRIEFTGLVGLSDDYGSTCLASYGLVDHIMATNCVFRDWQVIKPNGTPYVRADTPGWDNIGVGGMGSFGSDYGGEIEANNCIAHQSGVTQKSGSSFRNVSRVVGCTIYSTTQGVLGGYLVNDSHIYSFPSPSNATGHNNAIEIFGPSDIQRNLIHDLANETAPILTAPDWDNGNAPAWGPTYIRNNVLYNCGWQTPIAISTGGNPSETDVYVENNTVDAGSGYCFRTAFKAGIGPYRRVELKNNHFITTASPYALEGAVTTFVESNNLTQTPTVAASAGYTVANTYQPQSVSRPTVGAGLDLSGSFTTDRLGVTRSSPWDIGAYEFSGTAPAGNLSFSTSMYSTAEDTTLVITVSRTGGASGTVGATWQLDDGTALAGTDYTDGGTTVSLGNGVSSTTFNVTILRNSNHTGNRYFTATLSSATGGATIVSPSTATITITDSDPEPEEEIPTFTQAGGDISIPARLMRVTQPFSIANNVVTQTIETTTTNTAGRLEAYCVVTNSGSPTFEFEIFGNFAHAGADSGFLRLNGTNDICDVIPLTSGFETRKVNWRGSGTFSAPEKQPLRLVIPGPSTNLIVWYGREPHSISNITWRLQSTPPPAPQQLRFASSTAWTYDSGLTVQIPVTRVGSSGTVTVDYATTNGTAEAGTDYTATSGTLTFAAGVTSLTITVPVVNHPAYDGNKLFSLVLSNPSAAAVVSDPSLCSVAILDDQSPPFPQSMRFEGRVLFQGKWSK